LKCTRRRHCHHQTTHYYLQAKHLASTPPSCLSSCCCTIATSSHPCNLVHGISVVPARGACLRIPYICTRPNGATATTSPGKSALQGEVEGGVQGWQGFQFSSLQPHHYSLGKEGKERGGGACKPSRPNHLSSPQGQQPHLCVMMTY